MSVPIRDSKLVPYITNFNTKIGASFASYGLTSAQATALDVVVDPYLVAANAVIEARQAKVGTQILTAIRESKKEALLPVARQFYGIIQELISVPDELKLGLGITLKPDGRAAPKPAVGTAPALTAIKVFGHHITVGIKDSTGERKGRAKFAAGASLFSFVGANPPTGDQVWKSEGNVTKDKIIVLVPEAIPAGAKIWFTAYWYNTTGLSSPACTPISTVVGTEGAEPLAS
jgi:hypothetical protein